MSARYLIQKYYCELEWALRCVFLRVSRKENSARAQTEFLLRRRDALRRMLREYPYWMLGHTRLGITELELFELSDVPLSGPARATIRLSGEAAKSLGAAFPRQSAGRAAFEAEFLIAMLSFTERDLAKAYEKFQELNREEVLKQLSLPAYRMLLTHHAACAQVLQASPVTSSLLH